MLAACGKHRSVLHHLKYSLQLYPLALQRRASPHRMQPSPGKLENGELGTADNPLPASVVVATADAVSNDSGDRQYLLQKFVVVPRSRRLQSLKDLGLLLLAALPYAIMKLVRVVMGLLGVSEHRWKGVPNDIPLTQAGRDRIKEVVPVLRAGTLNKQMLLPAQPTSAMGLSTVSMNQLNAIGPAATAILQHMFEVITALEIVCQQHGFGLSQEHKSHVYNEFACHLEHMATHEAVNPQDIHKALRKAGKKCIKRLLKSASTANQYLNIRAKAVLQDYEFQCLMQMSLGLPATMNNTLMQLDEGQEVVESCALLSLQPGLDYLQTQGQDFTELAATLAAFPRVRPSDAKKPWQVQAMTINARLHSIGLKHKDGATTQVSSYIRSGAFAAHGRKPKGIGLSRLLATKAAVQRAQAINKSPSNGDLPVFNNGSAANGAAADGPSLADRAKAMVADVGYNSLVALEEEIKLRTVLCVTQALPVVVASIQQMCRQRTCMEAAYRTGRFLHVQQSLLSDLHTSERSYLQDTKGALEILQAQLHVKFVFKPAKLLEVEPGRITLYLDQDSVPESAVPSDVATRGELMSTVYRLTTIVFTQGINAQQSLGFFKLAPNEETVQDLINKEGLERLNNYAMEAGQSTSAALAELNQHYSPKRYRAAKDVEAVRLVRRACNEIGGNRAVNCKSGKDRTALEVATSFSQEMCAAGHVPTHLQHTLHHRLLGGLSYQITGQNNGQPNAYAFSELELVTLPPGWAPAWQLCGKVMS